MPATDVLWWILIGLQGIRLTTEGQSGTDGDLICLACSADPTSPSSTSIVHNSLTNSRCGPFHTAFVRLECFHRDLTAQIPATRAIWPRSCRSLLLQR